MSSLRNAVARRPHKERSQPQSREKWGLLEKHKDYALRAQDYNLKKKKLALLSRKARDRNPDEFAFGMLSERTNKQGKHGAAGTEHQLSHDTVKLLKTQDAGYLRTVMAKDRRELKRLEEEVGMDAVRITREDAFGKKTVFVDGEMPQRGKKRNASGFVLDALHDSTGDTVEQAVVGEAEADIFEEDNDDENRPRTEPSKPPPIHTPAVKQDAMARLEAERTKRKKLQEMRVAKLAALKKRQREIMAAADQLDVQRAKMARTIGGVNKNGVKFKIRERKK